MKQASDSVLLLSKDCMHLALRPVLARHRCFVLDLLFICGQQIEQRLVEHTFVPWAAGHW